MSEGGRHVRPGAAPDAAEQRDAADESRFVPNDEHADRAWPLSDPMRRVRADRQSAAARIHRSVTAWRKEDGGTGRPGNVKIPQSGGAAIAPDVRRKMEGQLGADLSSVRVHAGAEAAGAADGLRARAFTVGEDVHFGAGQYEPGTKEGDRLLAHELTHVVQGQRSGIQRKAHDTSTAGGDGAQEPSSDAKPAGAQAEVAGDGGHEVSQPGEPAEQEADAVADHVADQLHGSAKDKDKKNKQKDKQKKDKEKRKGGAGGSDDQHSGAHETQDSDSGDSAAESPAAHDAKPNGAPGGASERKQNQSAGEGAQATGAVPTEKAPAIGAKLSGAARKVFLARPPAAAAAATRPPAAAAAPPAAASVNDPASLRAFCAPDPIAIQKLNDVDGEVNMDPSVKTNAAAKQEWYQKVINDVKTAPNVNPRTVFNAFFNDAAKNLKFMGKKIAPEKINSMCSRTCGLKGWYWSAVNRGVFVNQVRAYLGDPSADQGVCEQLGYDLFQKQAASGANLMSTMQKGVDITKRSGPTWFTPDSYKLSAAPDAGYAELLRLGALQPEWFPEGNVVFEIAPAGFVGQCRKPTAYDGMQSSLWVSRPQGDDFGVTGGSANEFLAGNVNTSGVKSAKAVVPSPELRGEIQTAVQRAKDNALMQDPQLRTMMNDPATRDKANAMVPNLTDQFIRGDISNASIPTLLRNALTDVTRRADAERGHPSAPRPGTGTPKHRL